MIEIQGIKKRDENRQVAYITVDGVELSVGNVPIELTKTEDIQAHLDARFDKFKLLILRKLYRGSDHLRFQKEDMTELEAIEAWITKGHKNKIIVGYYKNGKPKYGYQVIEKQELKYRHPKWIGLKAKIEEANITPELKSLLKEIVK